MILLSKANNPLYKRLRTQPAAMHYFTLSFPNTFVTHH